MISKAEEHYRGVHCIHCREPIPLSPSAERKEKQFQDHGPSGIDEFDVPSATLRCRACHGEGVYKHSDVIEIEGSPRKRGSRAQRLD
jgi:hypothetical protein